jgi:hypothetical protein
VVLAVVVAGVGGFFVGRATQGDETQVLPLEAPVESGPGVKDVAVPPAKDPERPAEDSSQNDLLLP